MPPYYDTGGIWSYTDADEALGFLRRENPEGAAAIEALPWVADGLSGVPEHEGAWSLTLAAQLPSDELLRALLMKSWVQDEMTIDQGLAVSGLTTIARTNMPAALRILDMPFLDSVELLDWKALYSLGNLAEDGYLDSALAHPSFRDGITDDRIGTVTVMWYPLRRPGYADLVPIMADPQQTVALQRSITLPLAGEMDLHVVWPAHGATEAKATQTMDLLEDTLRVHEEFMGVAYPKPYVIVLVADINQNRGGGGGNSVVTMDPPFYDDLYLMAHEVAHTYWPFAPRWIAEGGANFMDSIYLRDRDGQPLPTQTGCDGASSLAELVAKNINQGDVGYTCNYRLSEDMYLELYRTLGDATFRKAWGTYYTYLADEALYVRCLNEPKGLCYTHAAFVEGLPEHAAVTQEIINRHYYGL